MAMTLRLTGEETEALREQAELEGRSVQAVVHAAIREYLERAHRARVAAVTALVAERYQDALRRLGEA